MSLKLRYSLVKAFKWVFSRVFSLRNITGPLKFLGTLLLGYRYVTREERLNNKKLEEAWLMSGLGSKDLKAFR